MWWVLRIHFNTQIGSLSLATRGFKVKYFNLVAAWDFIAVLSDAATSTIVVYSKYCGKWIISYMKYHNYFMLWTVN